MFNKDQFYQASSAQNRSLSGRMPKTLPRALERERAGIAKNRDHDSPECQQKIPDVAGDRARIVYKSMYEQQYSGNDGEALHLKSQFKCQKTSGRQQAYIPGLNSPSDPNVNVATKPKEAAKEVPEALIEGFLSGSKNPISTLMEYSIKQKIVVVFEECRVERPSIVARFACRVKVNGKPFPQGTGKTKKDAKTAAAKIAMSKLLGLEAEDVESEEGMFGNNL